MDQLRHKLFDHTETPPPGVWQKVESALDQGMPSLSKKLIDYTAVPPQGAWSRIESSLQVKNEPAKVVRIKRVIRIAAAAVILFAVFMTVRLFSPAGENQQVTALPSNPAPVPAENIPDEPATQQAEQTVKKKPAAFYRAPAKVAENRVAENRPAAARKARYTTISNDEGQTVRLSRKVAPVFDCAGAKIKSISARCRDDIKALQEKMGSSLTSPSGDFSGLIDLLKSLEGDQ